MEKTRAKIIMEQWAKHCDNAGVVPAMLISVDLNNNKVVAFVPDYIDQKSLKHVLDFVLKNYEASSVNKKYYDEKNDEKNKA